MSRKCDLSGKAVLTGNNVSHAKNRTRRRFLPNLQNIRLKSDILKRNIRFSIATSTLRTVERRGGLDVWLLSQPDRKLAEKGLKIKREILKAQPVAQLTKAG